MDVTGYKYAEIAERMHLPLSTVKSTYFTVPVSFLRHVWPITDDGAH